MGNIMPLIPECEGEGVYMIVGLELKKRCDGQAIDRNLPGVIIRNYVDPSIIDGPS